MTGECSECTNRLTSDCLIDLFVADRSDRSLEGLSTGRFDSDQGDLFYNSVPKEESPSGGFPPKGKPLDWWPEPEPHTY